MTGESAPSPRQVLLTSGDVAATGVAPSAGLEAMITLQPCGHAFPREALDTVEAQLDHLDALIDRHTLSTNALEIQCLREDIHAIGWDFNVAADRCMAQMVATPPRTDGHPD